MILNIIFIWFVISSVYKALLNNMSGLCIWCFELFCCFTRCGIKGFSRTRHCSMGRSLGYVNNFFCSRVLQVFDSIFCFILYIGFCYWSFCVAISVFDVFSRVIEHLKSFHVHNCERELCLMQWKWSVHTFSWFVVWIWVKHILGSEMVSDFKRVLGSHYMCEREVWWWH